MKFDILTLITHLDSFSSVLFANFTLQILRRHCLKSARIQSFSGPSFSAFGVSKEIYCVNIPIQSECGKIRTRKTHNIEAFYAVMLQKHQT